MFCPTCGKDNALELKYCASCGTNLEAVSQALSGREEDFFTKMDMGIDQLVARYSEHVFRNAPQAATERKVSRSWQLLGQAVVTSFLDILLFFLMWNVLPLRFVILLVSTPFRILSQRNESERSQPQSAQRYIPPALPEPARGQWLADSVSASPKARPRISKRPSALNSRPRLRPMILNDEHSRSRTDKTPRDRRWTQVYEALPHPDFQI